MSKSQPAPDEKTKTAQVPAQQKRQLPAEQPSSEKSLTQPELTSSISQHIGQQVKRALGGKWKKQTHRDKKVQGKIQQPRGEQSPSNQSPSNQSPGLNSQSTETAPDPAANPEEKVMNEGQASRQTKSAKSVKSSHPSKPSKSPETRVAAQADKPAPTESEEPEKSGPSSEQPAKKQPAAKPPSNNQPVPGSFHARHPGIIKFLKIIFFPLINPWVRYLLLGLIIAGIGAIFYLVQQLPSPRRLINDDNYAVSTQIFDRNRTLLYEIYGDENRVPVNVAQLPAHVKQATIAIEDKNFYHHFGLDIQGIVRAMRNNLQTESLEGGSTITQQLVKNALLTPERSLQRKVKEALLAILTELIYSKSEILEMYLNYISYGGTAVGIEAASQKYFDKSATELSLAEAALLAGLPQAPSRYSPFGSNPQQAQNRQAEVLRRMAEDGYITAARAEQAKTETLNFALSKTEIAAPHFVFYVRDLLYEEYGVEQVEKGGLRVQTSLDLALQETAQASVSAEVEKLKNYKVGNGAAIITRPNTGEILAMVGSRDYFDSKHDGQVNVTLAMRQPGSSIKPLMYATTFQEKTLNPGTIMLDQPTCFAVVNQEPYCPRNYTGGFAGMVTIRKALGNSLNIPAVKALSTIGVKTFMDQATAMGISTWHDPSHYGLSLTLGGGEVKMIDMAQAYGTLANQGVKVPLAPILKVENYRGEVLEEVSTEERLDNLNYLNNYESSGKKDDLERVMDRAPAYLVSHIMQDNQARLPSFRRNSELVIPDQIVSAKTGTTNDLKDNWTLGFTPEVLVVTWVGNNDSKPMSRLASGVTGAAPIFNDLMSYLLQDKEPIWQEKPPDVMSGKVCANGMPPEASSEPCSVLNTDLFWSKSIPSNSKFVKQKLWIDPNTGEPPPPGEHVDGLELQERTIIQDPVTAVSGDGLVRGAKTEVPSDQTSGPGSVNEAGGGGTTDSQQSKNQQRHIVPIQDGKLKQD
jgi:1A family penicillin-binding protein